MCPTLVRWSLVTELLLDRAPFEGTQSFTFSTGSSEFSNSASTESQSMELHQGGRERQEKKRERIKGWVWEGGGWGIKTGWEKETLGAFICFYREKARYKLGHTQLSLWDWCSGDFQLWEGGWRSHTQHVMTSCIINAGSTRGRQVFFTSLLLFLICSTEPALLMKYISVFGPGTGAFGFHRRTKLCLC